MFCFVQSTVLTSPQGFFTQLPNQYIIQYWRLLWTFYFIFFLFLFLFYGCDFFHRYLIKYLTILYCIELYVNNYNDNRYYPHGMWGLTVFWFVDEMVLFLMHIVVGTTFKHKHFFKDISQLIFHDELGCSTITGKHIFSL